MESNEKLLKLNELSYKTLGRFLGTATMLQTYIEIHNGNVPKERLEVLLKQFIDITKEYNTYCNQVENDAKREQEGKDSD